VLDARIFTPFWQYLGPLVKCERDMRDSIAVVNHYVYELIRERKQDPELEKRTDLLSRYLLLKDENGKPFTESYLRDIILNIIIAGRDTTAQTLTWCFYLLSQNERVLQKLLDELAEQLGGADPTYDNVKNLKYIQAVIDETLRLYPPVPIDPKMALNDDVLPNGFVIKKGFIVEWNQWVMGRHPDFWDCPTEMRPERWFGDNGGKPVPHGNQPPFIPFQFGPRTCIGIQFAYLEIKVVLCSVLQAGLRLKLHPHPPVEVQSSITLTCRYGMPMTVHTS